MRSCIAPKLLHLLRTLDPSGLEETWTQANTALLGAVSRLATIGPEPELDDRARGLAMFPLKNGGLGLPNYVRLLPHARRASRDLCEAVAQHIDLFRERPSGADREFLTASRSQSEQKQFMREMVDDLLSELDDRHRLTVIENASDLRGSE